MIEILKPPNAWVVETGGPFLAATEVSSGSLNSTAGVINHRLEHDFGTGIPLAIARMAMWTVEVEAAAAAAVSVIEFIIGLKITDGGVTTYQAIGSSGDFGGLYGGASKMEGLDLLARMGNRIAGLSGTPITGYFTDFGITGGHPFTIDDLKMSNCYIYLSDDAIVDVG